MKILIADDHELFRDGLRHVLEQLGDGLTVLEAADYHQALDVAESQTDIDIVLMDLAMPGMPWGEGLQSLRERLSTNVPIIVLSASDDRRHVLQAVNLGAAGFIPKTSSSRVMLSALKLVMSGGVYLPPALLEQTSASAAYADSPGAPFGVENGASFLTPRQREVLTLLGQGKSNKEIARVLQLAEGTVKLHVTAILKALNVNNRTRAVVRRLAARPDRAGRRRLSLTAPMPAKRSGAGPNRFVQFRDEKIGPAMAGPSWQGGIVHGPDKSPCTPLPNSAIPRMFRRPRRLSADHLPSAVGGLAGGAPGLLGAAVDMDGMAVFAAGPSVPRIGAQGLHGAAMVGFGIAPTARAVARQGIALGPLRRRLVAFVEIPPKAIAQIGPEQRTGRRCRQLAGAAAEARTGQAPENRTADRAHRLP